MNENNGTMLRYLSLSLAGGGYFRSAGRLAGWLVGHPSDGENHALPKSASALPGDWRGAGGTTNVAPFYSPFFSPSSILHAGMGCLCAAKINLSRFSSPSEIALRAEASQTHFCGLFLLPNRPKKSGGSNSLTSPHSEVGTPIHKGKSF